MRSGVIAQKVGMTRVFTEAGAHVPASVKTLVIPTFCAITPERMGVSSIPKKVRSEGSKLDLDVDAGGKIELHQRVHRLRRRIDDIEQAFVRAHFELLAA